MKYGIQQSQKPLNVYWYQFKTKNRINKSKATKRAYILLFQPATVYELFKIIEVLKNLKHFFQCKNKYNVTKKCL